MVWVFEKWIFVNGKFSYRRGFRGSLELNLQTPEGIKELKEIVQGTNTKFDDLELYLNQSELKGRMLRRILKLCQRARKLVRIMYIKIKNKEISKIIHWCSHLKELYLERIIPMYQSHSGVYKFL